VRHNGLLAYRPAKRWQKPRFSVGVRERSTVAIDHPCYLPPSTRRDRWHPVDEPGPGKRRIADDLWSSTSSSPPTADLMIQPDAASTRFSGPTRRSSWGGGPQGDAGMTGRKFIVWTPTAATGGPGATAVVAFSGKDPTKWTAPLPMGGPAIVQKSLVGGSLAAAPEVKLGYAIGLARPDQHPVQSFALESWGTRSLTALVSRALPILRPRAIHRKALACAPFPRSAARFYQHCGGLWPFGRDMI